MNIDLNIQNLEKHLSENSSSKIWSQKARPGKLSSKIIFTLLTLFLSIGYIYFFVFAVESQNKLLDYFMHLLMLTYAIGFYYKNFQVAESIEYSIYPETISFNWGFFRKKEEIIPFSDITAIELVEYSDKKTSTIHFGTGKNYNIPKLDFENNGTRVHITFENIINGKEVYDLLKLLQKKAN